MVNVKMTLEDRNKYLSIIDHEIDSKLSDLSKSRNVEQEQENPDLLNTMNESSSVKKELLPTMNLAQRDKYLSQIDQEIKSKKKLLLEKRKYLKNISGDNSFLSSVNNDYQTYYDFIIKQKEDQMKTLNYLNDYIQDIMVNMNLTEQDILEANKEKKRILGEIKNIRKSLEEIIET
uniref:Uncharacterized protein n=1 Tax=viral metagenome TaxID=1070528 RepID=A0A6C0H906_9ZZZZ